MNVEFESIWQEAVETEVNNRLAERELQGGLPEANSATVSSIITLKSCASISQLATGQNEIERAHCHVQSIGLNAGL
jgi:hypothetical protein